MLKSSIVMGSASFVLGLFLVACTNHQTASVAKDDNSGADYDNFKLSAGNYTKSTLVLHLKSRDITLAPGSMTKDSDNITKMELPSDPNTDFDKATGEMLVHVKFTVQCSDGCTFKQLPAISAYAAQQAAQQNQNGSFLDDRVGTFNDGEVPASPAAPSPAAPAAASVDGDQTFGVQTVAAWQPNSDGSGQHEGAWVVFIKEDTSSKQITAVSGAGGATGVPGSTNQCTGTTTADFPAAKGGSIAGDSSCDGRPNIPPASRADNGFND